MKSNFTPLSFHTSSSFFLHETLALILPKLAQATFFSTNPSFLHTPLHLIQVSITFLSSFFFCISLALFDVFVVFFSMICKINFVHEWVDKVLQFVVVLNNSRPILYFLHVYISCLLFFLHLYMLKHVHTNCLMKCHNC